MYYCQSYDIVTQWYKAFDSLIFFSLANQVWRYIFFQWKQL